MLLLCRVVLEHGLPRSHHESLEEQWINWYSDSPTIELLVMKIYDRIGRHWPHLTMINNNYCFDIRSGVHPVFSPLFPLFHVAWEANRFPYYQVLIIVLGTLFFIHSKCVHVYIHACRYNVEPTEELSALDHETFEINLVIPIRLR